MSAYPCIFMHMSAYPCICLHTNAYVCVSRAYVSTSMHIHTYVCISVHMSAYPCGCQHIHAYSCICLHMHAYPPACACASVGCLQGPIRLWVCILQALEGDPRGLSRVTLRGSREFKSLFQLPLESQVFGFKLPRTRFRSQNDAKTMLNRI